MVGGMTLDMYDTHKKAKELAKAPPSVSEQPGPTGVYRTSRFLVIKKKKAPPSAIEGMDYQCFFRHDNNKVKL